jgi:Domain of unknown function (DUF4440)
MFHLPVPQDLDYTPPMKLVLVFGLLAPLALLAAGTPALPQQASQSPAPIQSPATATGVPTAADTPMPQPPPLPADALGNDLDTSGRDIIFIQEMRLWQALQAKDMVTFSSLLMPDFLEVNRTILSREQTLANLNACLLVGFKMANHQVRVLTPDIAVIAYTGTNDVTCGEAHLTGSYNATTTWVRHDGKWMVQIHTEIPIKSPPAKPAT